eukprot:scaffold2102_cov161-Amphora_coffeaeformis.AAC.19
MRRTMRVPAGVTSDATCVRSFLGWTPKRIAATKEEKKVYHHFRRGDAYFVEVCFTVPGETKKPNKKASKKKAPPAKRKAAPKQAVDDTKPPAEKKAKAT